MPPRLNIIYTCWALSIRSRPLAQWPQQSCTADQARRLSSDSHGTTRPLEQNAGGLPPSLFSPAVTPSENKLALSQLQKAAYGLDPFDPKVEGHKFGMPTLPIPAQMNHKNRYDPVVTQMTKLLMRDGKLSKAQRVITSSWGIYKGRER